MSVVRACGALWHAALLRLAGLVRHRQAMIALEHLRAGVELHYHLLGGEPSRRVVGDARTAWMDAAQVHLPARIDRYPDRALNRELYFWLSAFLAVDRPLEGEAELPRGLRHLLRGAATSGRVVERFPPLAERYRRLCAAELAQRAAALPGWDAPSTQPARVLEAGIRAALRSGRPPPGEWLQGLLLSRSSHLPFLPVPLWGLRAEARGPRWSLLRRSKRRRDQGEERPLGRPRFDPGARPGRADGARAIGPWTYPEWAWQRRAYRPAWCEVIEQAPMPSGDGAFEPWGAAQAAGARRAFEALRQAAGWERRRESGDELDLDAYVESACDARGCGRRGGRVYRRRVQRRASLSVAALMDTSRSTEAWVRDRRVIQVAREGMFALAEALHGSGEDFGLYAFASDTRLRVRCYRIKGFEERYGEACKGRLLALKPERYTRMGAAIRHVGGRLGARASAQKLLLVLTDGRPHDPADGYEGRYALEDTRRALLELRTRGIQCFGLAIDQDGRDFLPRLFGPGHYALLPDAGALSRALPRLYARLTAQS